MRPMSAEHMQQELEAACVQTGLLHGQSSRPGHAEIMLQTDMLRSCRH